MSNPNRLIKQPTILTKPDVLESIQNQNSWCLNAMKLTAQRVFDLVWHNEFETPQQVCDSMGVDAVKGFEAHSKLQELIYLIDPTWVPLEPTHEYVKNQDGTVTIGEPK